MIVEKIKDEIQSAVQLRYGKHLKANEIEVEKPQNKAYGDYATNVAFKLAGQLSENPQKIAEELAADLNKIGIYETVTATGAFVNFKLTRKVIGETVREILAKKENFGKNDLLKGKNVQVEFVSANPTGPLTLANGRGGFGGDVLANLFEFSGAKVEREFYINDGGNQIKILGNSILFLHQPKKTKEELYKGEYINDWESKHQKIVAKYQSEPFELGQIAAGDILEKQIKPAVAKMNIKFDKWFSEREMIESGEVDQSIQKFGKFGHTYEKDGALWMKTMEFGDDKDRVLLKSDGEKTYFANDTAYHFDKFSKRKFDKVVDFWGADHHGYVARMLAAVSAMGFPGRLEVVILQMVRLIKNGKEFRMSKRKGTYVAMDDLLELIGGKDAADVARFFFLSHSFNTHMDFDLDLAQKRTEKNPVYYVKYAHARICGILENSKNLKLPKANLNLLSASEEMELAEILSGFPALISGIVLMKDYPVHLLTFYVRDLATAFHRFYDKCRVIDEADLKMTSARLALVQATQIVLKTALEKIIGVEAPVKM